MSAEQKKKISETMKRRYAQINKTATKAASQVSKVESVGGSRLTAAGRKKLSDLMKKRWAERRKGMMK
jgi:Spy/CpxP family protein refolding chaperone